MGSASASANVCAERNKYSRLCCCVYGIYCIIPSIHPSVFIYLFIYKSCSSSGGSSASAPEERTKERKHQSWHTSHAVLPISSGRFRLDFLARVEVAAAASARALPAIKDSRLMGRGSDSLPSDNNSRRRRRRVLLLHESNVTTEAYSLLLPSLHLHWWRLSFFASPKNKNAF
jgi:hypothetical protein